MLCVFYLSAILDMVQRTVSRTVLCTSFLLLGVFLAEQGAVAAGLFPTFPHEQVSGEVDLEDLEWGSGSSLLHLLHSFPADSPFVTETPGKPVNCTQRFWLPPSSDICWDNIVGPEEFAKSRLQVLQNRAALQALSDTSGVEEGGASYKHQAREEVQGIYSDHQSMVETLETMEKVFVSLEEKRKEGKDQGVLTRWETEAYLKDWIGYIWEQPISSVKKKILFSILNLQL